MKKTAIVLVLLMAAFSFAEQCYFQTRRTSYDSGTSVKKISCQTVKNVMQDVHFYNEKDNYTRYFGRQIGKEGNLIEMTAISLFQNFITHSANTDITGKLYIVAAMS